MQPPFKSALGFTASIIALSALFAAQISAQTVYVSAVFDGPHGPGPNGYQLGTLNLATGQYTEIGLTPNIAFTGLTFTPDGTLYGEGVSEGSTITPNQLYRIDPNTAATTFIGTATVSTPNNAQDFLLGLAARPGDGKLFATDFDDSLYTIDPHTGQATLVGTGLAAASLPEGDKGNLTFSPDGTLYNIVSANQNNNDILYTRDQTTGVPTQIGTMDTQQIFINGLVYADNQLYGIPIAFITRQDIYTIDMTTGIANDTGVSLPFPSAYGPNPILAAAVDPVPEPGACTLLASLGLTAAALLRRRIR